MFTSRNKLRDSIIYNIKKQSTVKVNYGLVINIYIEGTSSIEISNL